MKIVGSTPLMISDNGNKVTFIELENNVYRIDANYGGENVSLGILVVSESSLDYKKLSRDNVNFKEVSEENAKTYDLGRALSYFLDEIFPNI